MTGNPETGITRFISHLTGRVVLNPMSSKCKHFLIPVLYTLLINAYSPLWFPDKRHRMLQRSPTHMFFLFYFAGLTCDKCSLILLYEITAGIKAPVQLFYFSVPDLVPLISKRGYFSIIHYTWYFPKCTLDQSWLLKFYYFLSWLNTFICNTFNLGNQKESCNRLAKEDNSISLLTINDKKDIAGILKHRTSKTFFYQKAWNESCSKKEFFQQF